MPKSNSSLNKFNAETPASLSRKQEKELVENEMNDARKQVIRREFAQTALYNELFDRNRMKFGDITLEYKLNSKLQEYLNSIEKAKLKLQEGMPSPYNDIYGAYSTLVSELNAYVSSDKTKTADVNVWLTAIRQSADELNRLLDMGLTSEKQTSLVGLPKDKKNLSGSFKVKENFKVEDKDIINLYLLIQQVQSGYNLHQLDTTFKTYDSLPKGEQKKLDSILLKLRSGEKIDDVLMPRIEGKLKNRKQQLKLIKSDINKLYPDEIKALIQNLELEKKKELEFIQQQGIENEGYYRPHEPEILANVAKEYDDNIEWMKRFLKNVENGQFRVNGDSQWGVSELPPGLADEDDDGIIYLPPVNLPELKPGQPPGTIIDMTKKPPPPPPASPAPEPAAPVKPKRGRPKKGSGISATLCGNGNARGGFLRMAKSILSKLGRKAPEPVEEEGSGYARGGQAGFDLSRTYRIAEQWQNFPYFVPPNNPVVHMVNPRGRVHIPTEGNGFIKVTGPTVKPEYRQFLPTKGNGRGGFLPLLAARVVGKKLLKNVGKKVATKVATKVAKNAAKNAFKSAMEQNENEEIEGKGNARGGFMPGNYHQKNQEQARYNENRATRNYNREQDQNEAIVKAIPGIAKFGTQVAKYELKKKLASGNARGGKGSLMKTTDKITDEVAHQTRPARNALKYVGNVNRAMSGEGKKKAKKAGKPTYDVI